MSRRLASLIVLGCLFGAAAVATSPPALAQQQEVESAALINSLYTKHFTTKVQTEVIGLRISTPSNTRRS